MKEMLRRAVRTFLQAFISYVAVNAVTLSTGLTEGTLTKTFLSAFIISAVAAGLAAVMNLPDDYGKEEDYNGKD